jgi:hypothetical protein
MAHCPCQPQKITGGVGGLARMVGGIRGIRGPSREPCWYRGIAVDGGGTVPADAAALMWAATPGQQAAPAWPARPAECNDRPWMNRLPVSRCRASQFPLTSY